MLRALGELRVDQDDGNTGFPGLLDGRHQRVRIGRCENNTSNLTVDGVFNHVDLVGNRRFSSRTLEGHGVAGRILHRRVSALLDVLPEGGVDGLDDDGDFTGLHGGNAPQRDCGCQKGSRNFLHFFLRDVGIPGLPCRSFLRKGSAAL
ncbi:hypothetical protein D3C72_1881460 [compost metagenome]